MEILIINAFQKALSLTVLPRSFRVRIMASFSPSAKDLDVTNGKKKRGGRQARKQTRLKNGAINLQQENINHKNYTIFQSLNVLIPNPTYGVH